MAAQKPDKKFLARAEQAARSNDMSMLRQTVPRLPSPDCALNNKRESVLHIAGAEDHLAMVEYLAAMPGTMAAQNIVGQTPEQVAKGKSRMYLRTKAPLERAIAAAKAMFPDDVTTEKDHVYEGISAAFSARHIVELNDLYGSITGAARQRNLAQAGGERMAMPAAEYDRTMQADRLYALTLKGFIDMKLLLEIAQAADFKEGRCGLRAIAAAAHLLCREDMGGISVDNVVVLAQTAHGELGHQFLVIGVPYPKQFYDVATNRNEYGLVCDPYERGKTYSLHNIPADTSVLMLRNHSTTVGRSCTAYPTLVNEFVGYSLYRPEWDRLKDEIDRLLPPRERTAALPPPPL